MLNAGIWLAENLDPEFAHLHLEGAQRVAFYVEEGFAFEPDRAAARSREAVGVGQPGVGVEPYHRAVGQREAAFAVFGGHQPCRGVGRETFYDEEFDGHRQQDDCGRSGGRAAGDAEQSPFRGGRRRHFAVQPVELAAVGLFVRREDGRRVEPLPFLP